MTQQRRRPRTKASVWAAVALVSVTSLGCAIERQMTPGDRGASEAASAAREAEPRLSSHKVPGGARTNALRAERERRWRNVRPPQRIHWTHSRAVGSPWSGRLINGVHLPAEGRHFFTWDPIKKKSPNRAYRRFATHHLLRITLRVIRRYARAHPYAPRAAIGDLSRPHGGDFGKRFGGLGHSSHQNGLDVDIYYPRKDGRERAPRRPRQIDVALAQDLVDRFVRAGAQYVFVGPDTHLAGSPRIVQELVHHNDHMHVRVRAR